MCKDDDDDVLTNRLKLSQKKKEKKIKVLWKKLRAQDAEKYAAENKPVSTLGDQDDEDEQAQDNDDFDEIPEMNDVGQPQAKVMIGQQDEDVIY